MRQVALIVIFTGVVAPACHADDVIYGYEGNVVLSDPSSGWIVANACAPPCSESADGGYFYLRWPTYGHGANYHYHATNPGEAPPESLWIEWRRRSNHPVGLGGGSCGGAVSILYKDIHDVVEMCGDFVGDWGGGGSVSGLELNAFHTMRFESIDGNHYRLSVDGKVFYEHGSNPQTTDFGTVIQYRGYGGCNFDWVPNTEIALDYLRFGTISTGERVIASDPPQGFLDARRCASCDRFTVTFDKPNYVYLNEITVTGADASDLPAVVATVRPDESGPDTVEVVLDRPIPLNRRTRFVIDDGTVENTVTYLFAPGDVDGDGDADLADAAWLQNCYGSSDHPSPCQVFDKDGADGVDAADVEPFADIMRGPAPSSRFGRPGKGIK